MSFPYDQVYVITGSSGSGKSLACSFLDNLGASIVSADTIAKKCVEKGTVAYFEIIKTFGEEYVKPDGSIDRKKLHESITTDNAKKRVLEHILHPKISEEAKNEFSRLLQNHQSKIFYDCPLYFEKKLYLLGYKKSILIVAKNETKIKRIMDRDHISRTSAEKRLDLQISDIDKIKLADIVIENNGSIEELKTKITELFLSLP